jgi:hypothetical protein
MSRTRTEAVGSTILLPNLLPKAGRRGESRGWRAAGFQQLTDFYLRLRGFESHPLRHFFSKSFPVLNAAPDFPIASLLPNSGDFGGRITINRARFVPAFTAEIRARASGISARAMGLLSIACLIA